MAEKEYIERKLAVRAACEGAEEWDGGISIGRDRIITRYIKAVSAADVRPVVHGKWIEDESGVVICSNCGEEHEWDEYRANFCDNCGADMREKS